MGNQPGPGTTGPGASLPTANPGFCPGVLAAELLRRRFGNTRLHWRLPLLLAECGAILLVSCLPCGPLDPMANIIISFTSALQVESFRKFQGCGCVTTMCTGNLRSGTEHLFHWFFHREGTALKKVRVYYGLIGSFIAGAVLSGLLTPLLPAGPSWPPLFPCWPPSSSCSAEKKAPNPLCSNIRFPFDPESAGQNRCIHGFAQRFFWCSPLTQLRRGGAAGFGERSAPLPTIF